MDNTAELTRVVEWRKAKFLDLGYKYKDAVELATSLVDVYYVEALIARGATLDEAARIAR